MISESVEIEIRSAVPPDEAESTLAVLRAFGRAVERAVIAVDGEFMTRLLELSGRQLDPDIQESVSEVQRALRVMIEQSEHAYPRIGDFLPQTAAAILRERNRLVNIEAMLQDVVAGGIA